MTVGFRLSAPVFNSLAARVASRTIQAAALRRIRLAARNPRQRFIL